MVRDDSDHRQGDRIRRHGSAGCPVFVASFASHFWTNTTLTWLETNGQASVLVRRGDEVLTLATVDASQGGIERIFWMMNPEKLRAFAFA